MGDVLPVKNVLGRALGRDDQRDHRASLARGSTESLNSRSKLTKD